MSDEEDLEPPWPGFVDILSSVIIMFVFFVLIVASALFFHIIIFKAELEAKMAASSQEQESETAEDIVKEIQALQEKLKSMQESADNSDSLDVSELDLRQMGAQFSETKMQKIKKVEDQESTQDKDTYVIFFGDDSISVTEETALEMIGIIKGYKEKDDPSKIKIELVAAKNSGSNKSDVFAKNLSVSRGLNVRNLFLDSGIDMKNVNLNIGERSSIEGSYNWVMITFKKE